MYAAETHKFIIDLWLHSESAVYEQLMSYLLDEVNWTKKLKQRYTVYAIIFAYSYFRGFGQVR